LKLKKGILTADTFDKKAANPIESWD